VSHWRTIAEALLQDGLATERELRQTIEELYAFARDPHTVLGGPLVFQAWGRNAAGVSRLVNFDAATESAATENGR
jgi:hypothetical protein